jgi:hypothetical protein
MGVYKYRLKFPPTLPSNAETPRFFILLFVYFCSRWKVAWLCQPQRRHSQLAHPLHGQLLPDRGGAHGAERADLVKVRVALRGTNLDGLHNLQRRELRRQVRHGRLVRLLGLELWPLLAVASALLIDGVLDGRRSTVSVHVDSVPHPVPGLGAQVTHASTALLVTQLVAEAPSPCQWGTRRRPDARARVCLAP